PLSASKPSRARIGLSPFQFGDRLAGAGSGLNKERSVLPLSSVDSALAWRMAAIAFAVGFTVFGVVYSFGVFLEPIMADLGSGRSATSALYAIASSAFYFLGPATGSVGDRLGPRAIAGFGALSMGGGLAATAFVTDIGTAYLTYGLGVGIGAACAYVPTFAVIGGWFDRWRTRALSIAATGTGLGMLALPPLCAVIIERFGWRAACLVLAGISGTVLAISAALVRPVPRQSNVPASEPFGTTLRSRAFVQMYISWVFGTMALFVPLVFLPAFAVGRGADPVAASWLISIIGGASVLGRLGIGYVTSAGGTLLFYKGSVLAMAASYVIWLLLPTYGWLVVFATLLGIAYGVRIALVAPVLIELFGAARLGGLLGTFFTATGIAGLAGPTSANLAVDYWGGDTGSIALAIMLGALAYALVLPLKAATGPSS
ncbi:MAG: MFS transporter, partial [Hyphomicrobiaceae bacterium]